MMKNKLCCGIALSLVLISCSSKSKFELVEPPKEIVCNIEQDLKGDLESLILVPPERVTLKITKDTSINGSGGYNVTADIKLKFIKSENIEAGQGYNSYGPFMRLELFDKSGKKLDLSTFWMRSSMDSKELAGLIKNGDSEEIIRFEGSWITLYEPSNESNPSLEESKKFIEDLTKIAKIEIHSEIKEEKFDEGSSTERSSSGSSDCEEGMQAYEDYVEDYISFMEEFEQNPSNPDMISRQMEMTQKLSKHVSGLAECTDVDVIKKIAAINTRIYSLN